MNSIVLQETSSGGQSSQLFKLHWSQVHFPDFLSFKQSELPTLTARRELFPGSVQRYVVMALCYRIIESLPDEQLAGAVQDLANAWKEWQSSLRIDGWQALPSEPARAGQFLPPVTRPPLHWEPEE
ncbi:MAG: hypothetical protein ACT4P6_17545 [Gemmatimonadaceae bacterium]